VTAAPRNRSQEKIRNPLLFYPMNAFFPFFIASFIASCAWTILLIRINRRNRRLTELVGAWSATAILAAFWQAEALPWLWGYLKAVLLVWLCAMVLLVTAVYATWRVKEPGRRLLLCCAVTSLVVNVAAGVYFLWLATVSPGGV